MSKPMPWQIVADVIERMVYDDRPDDVRSKKPDIIRVMSHEILRELADAGYLRLDPDPSP